MIGAILFASLFCCGLYVLGDMILSPLKFWLKKFLTYPDGYGSDQYLIYKPLWGCAPCMASFWGSIMWWVYYAAFKTDFEVWLIMWVPSLFVIAFVNWILINLAETLERTADGG